MSGENIKAKIMNSRFIRAIHLSLLFTTIYLDSSEMATANPAIVPKISSMLRFYRFMKNLGSESTTKSPSLMWQIKKTDANTSETDRAIDSKSIASSSNTTSNIETVSDIAESILANTSERNGDLKSIRNLDLEARIASSVSNATLSIETIFSTVQSILANTSEVIGDLEPTRSVDLESRVDVFKHYPEMIENLRKIRIFLDHFDDIMDDKNTSDFQPPEFDLSYEPFMLNDSERMEPHIIMHAFDYDKNISRNWLVTNRSTSLEKSTASFTNSEESSGQLTNDEKSDVVETVSTTVPSSRVYTAFDNASFTNVEEEEVGLDENRASSTLHAIENVTLSTAVPFSRVNFTTNNVAFTNSEETESNENWLLSTWRAIKSTPFAMSSTAVPSSRASLTNVEKENDEKRESSISRAVETTTPLPSIDCNSTDLIWSEPIFALGYHGLILDKKNGVWVRFSKNADIDFIMLHEGRITNSYKISYEDFPTYQKLFRGLNKIEPERCHKSWGDYERRIHTTMFVTERGTLCDVTYRLVDSGNDAHQEMHLDSSIIDDIRQIAFAIYSAANDYRLGSDLTVFRAKSFYCHLYPNTC